MTGLLIIAVLVVLLGVLANRFGVDSRDGRDWSDDPGPRRSRYPAYVGQL